MGKVSTFAARLRELLDQKGFTQAHLSQLSGVSKSSITHYLKGDWEGKQDTVYAIANAANVSEAWLMGYDVPMEKSTYDVLLQTAEDRVYQEAFVSLSKKEKELALNIVRSCGLPSNAIPYTASHKAPIVGSIPAGYPVLALEDIEGYADIPYSDEENYFFLRVNGESMKNAGIHTGDLVLIRRQKCADDGQVVAARVNGDEATLKRYKRQGDSVLLLPENPDFEPRIVPVSDFETGDAEIIGVALEVRHTL